MGNFKSYNDVVTRSISYDDGRKFFSLAVQVLQERAAWMFGFVSRFSFRPWGHSIIEHFSKFKTSRIIVDYWQIFRTIAFRFSYSNYSNLSLRNFCLEGIEYV